MASKDNAATDKLKEVSLTLVKALGDKAMGSVSDRVSGLTDKFDGIADGSGPVGQAVSKGSEAAAEGDSAVGGAVKGALSGVKDKITGGGGSKGGSKPTKAINIVETIDVGVPVRVAYNQWTQYDDWSTMMKKVENADRPDDDEPKVKFKGQIFLSHRQWEATITDQIPDERIVWKSEGPKGHVDGAVTFHELGPNFTRILIVLEYYPQGPFEWVGNRWRAQGRRARLEFKNFRRHVMTRTILDPDAVEGWRAVIEDGEIVKSHEEVVEEEQEQEDSEEEPEGEYDESEPEEEPEDEYEEPEEEPEDEYEEPEEAEEEPEYDEEPEEEAEDEYEEETEPEDEEPEEKPTRRRRRAS
jgi:uncharacterized membrane protein